MSGETDTRLHELLPAKVFNALKTPPAVYPHTGCGCAPCTSGRVLADFLEQQQQNSAWGTLIAEIIQWQRTTFKDYTPQSSLKHLIHETVELEREPYDIEEWADALFMVIQGADRVTELYGGWTSDLADPIGGGGDIRRTEHQETLLEATQRKFAKNKLREWNEPDAEGVILHKKDNDTTPEE